MASQVMLGGSPTHPGSFASFDSPPSFPPVQRKPLPPNVDLIPGLVHPSSPSSNEGDKPTFIPPAPVARSPSPSSVDGDPDISVQKHSNRYTRNQHSRPLQIDTSGPRHTSASYLRSVLDDDDDSDEAIDYFDEEYEHQFTNGTSLHSRLDSEPFIPVLNSPPATQASSRRATSMALHQPLNKPPSLHIDVNHRSMSMPMGAGDPRQTKPAGKKISSFFSWKAANNNNTVTSPGGESSSTEISDSGRSVMPNPMPPLANVPYNPSYTKPNGNGASDRTPSLGSSSLKGNGNASNVQEIENELRDISAELAASIRREMDLEDIVERLQSEGTEANRRTSDYFSDSGTSSVRYASDAGKGEDIEKVRRAAEQERAQLKIEFTKKLQDERNQLSVSESHVKILESQIEQLRRDRTDRSDLSFKTEELEMTLETTKRRLLAERESNQNFEGLLTAVRVELEQLRDERDKLRDGNKLAEENEALRIENASLAQLQGGRFASIAEEGGSPRSSSFGLSRSNSLARKPSSLVRSDSPSRSNSISNNKGGNTSETRESLTDKVQDVEAQRDALHQTVRNLLAHRDCQARDYEKRARALELELALAQQSGAPRKLGYERDVNNLRDEVNELRLRAEDALDGKWKCEENLAGLKMGLDRAEQETSSLRVLLQEDNAAAELVADQDGSSGGTSTSSSLKSALQRLQADRDNAMANATDKNELALSWDRTEVLGTKVNYQLRTNATVHARLVEAIDKGEKDQQISVNRINALQNDMKELEDSLVDAQQKSEDEMNKHEDEVRLLRESHTAQLIRIKNGGRTAASLSPRPSNTPFDARPPRLDVTSSGEGISLTEVVQTELLEKQVKTLERLLRDADLEMEQIIGRMNRTQIDVAQLQTDRDDALRQTSQLQAEIEAEHRTLKGLMPLCF